TGLVLLLVTSICELASAQDFHGAAILKTPLGPDGTPRAHVGDTITASITILNLDDFEDTVTLTNIVDIVHHKTGDVTTTNLLVVPVTLASYISATGGVFELDLTNTYLVLPGDETFPDGLLKDDAQAKGRDNHDGPSGSFLAQDFFITFP